MAALVGWGNNNRENDYSSIKLPQRVAGYNQGEEWTVS